MSKKILYDFYATWCGPCKVYSQILDSAEEELKSIDVEIHKVDVEENPELAQKYNVRNIPTTVYVEEDKVVFQQSGIIQKEQLLEKLNLNY